MSKKTECGRRRGEGRERDGGAKSSIRHRLVLPSPTYLNTTTHTHTHIHAHTRTYTTAYTGGTYLANPIGDMRPPSMFRLIAARAFFTRTSADSRTSPASIPDLALL